MNTETLTCPVCEKEHVHIKGTPPPIYDLCELDLHTFKQGYVWCIEIEESNSLNKSQLVTQQEIIYTGNKLFLTQEELSRVFELQTTDQFPLVVINPKTFTNLMQQHILTITTRH